ncbi:MAG: DUF445 domain-containing protein [Solirubrobacteraceae bacterium]
MSLKLILIPIISAIIGWFTNKIAIILLFYPENPINILGYTFQGIFPKRQKQLAKKIGKMVGEKLISIDELKQKLTNENTLQKIYKDLNYKIEEYILETTQEIKPISYLIPKKWILNLNKNISSKIEKTLPQTINLYLSEIEKEINIEKMVEEKINNLKSNELSQLLNSILKSEFLFIEILGGFLGFLIGILQVLMVVY